MIDFAPISAERLLVFMGLGGLFALAGLYMMMRPPAEGRAKIELFGLKFESSSAGLLVFIVGAVFLAVPLFVPEQRAAAPRAGASAPETLADDPIADTASFTSQNVAVTLPAMAAAQEMEPNDSVQQANLLPLGTTVAGGVLRDRDEADWYVVDASGHAEKRLEVGVRFVEGNRIKMTLLDGAEAVLDDIYTSDGVTRLSEWVGDQAAYFVRVERGTTSASPQRYELFHRFLED